MATFVMIGEKIKNLREESGLKQAQLAEYLNVDQSYISRLEKNERQLSIDMLEKLSNLFGCSIEYFTTDDGKYKPLPFALRATCVKSEDLEIVAAINKIALNMKSMESLLRRE